MVKTRQEVTGIIQKYVSNLKARGAAIDKVVLYGSFVGNRANEHSDIDIAVISSVLFEQARLKAIKANPNSARNLILRIIRPSC